MEPAPFDAITRALSLTLGGTSLLLDPATHDAAVVVLGGRHRVLVRRHAYVVGVSLPLEGAWQVRTEAEVPAVAEAIRPTLSTPAITTMSEVALAVRSVVTSPGLRLSFPGTPVPTEAWWSGEGGSIGLFQGEGSVRVVVWAGGAHEQRVHEGAPLDAAKLLAALAAQREERESILREEARIAALPPPSVEDVLAALRAGKTVMVGVSRCHTTWWWDDGLWTRLFDEGYEEQRQATERDLAQEIRNDPRAFLQALGR